MTESEWLSSAVPHFLYQHVKPHATRRQNQLVMAGFLRLIWDLLTDDRYRQYVTTLEAYAEDKASEAKYQHVVRQLPTRGRRYPVNRIPNWYGEETSVRVFRMSGIALANHHDEGGVVNFHELPLWCRTVDDAIRAATNSDVSAVMVYSAAAGANKIAADAWDRLDMEPESHPLLRQIAELQRQIEAGNSQILDLQHRGISALTEKSRQIHEAQQLCHEQIEDCRDALKAEMQAHVPLGEYAYQGRQAGLLRCVFGSPTRPITLDPTWRTETVVGLANTIEAEDAYDRLPILADALQDAGCDDMFVLNHARHELAHCRGCCVVEACRELTPAGLPVAEARA